MIDPDHPALRAQWQRGFACGVSLTVFIALLVGWALLIILS